MVYGVYTVKRKQIYIAERQEAQLREMAEHRGVSESHLIREAVAQYLLDQEEPALERAEDHPLWGLIGTAGDDASLPVDGALNPVR
ncbi:MAG: ribbon-helix-helix protein, CopG family [Dehalococcoidia bacterium]|nr:ribbon-helix-helix protein, CopG family [Dehalococcoidia bacterium]